MSSGSDPCCDDQIQRDFYLQSFLHKALMPLHKPKCVGLYHQQLAYCVTQVTVQLVFALAFVTPSVLAQDV